MHLVRRLPYLGLNLVVAAAFVLVFVAHGLVRALAAFAVLWFILFMAGLLMDEDVNHWDWPTDTGPGRRVEARIAGVAALLAAVPCALVYWFTR